MKLSDLIKFVDSIRDAVSESISGIESKFSAKIEALNGDLSKLKEVASKSATSEAIETVMAAISMQSEDLRNEIDAKLKAPAPVGIKAITLSGEKSLSVETSDGNSIEFEIPVISGKDGLNGVDGKDGINGIDGKNGLDGKNGIDGANGADGADGKDGEAGKDGRDGLDGKDGADGRDGVDGKDGANGENGRDGKDGLNGVGVKTVYGDGSFAVVALTNGEEYKLEMPRPEAPALPNEPREPIDVRDALIDRDGALVITFSDGTTKNVGRIVGRDGINGIDGRDGVNGVDGRDGVDGPQGPMGLPGFGFEDMDLSLDDDGRTVKFTFQRGENVKEFRMKFPVMIYREVYDGTKTYERGDVVTYLGGSFHANREVVGVVPGTGDAWMQIAAPGRSIRGERGLAGKDGKNGRDGQDYTRHF